MKVLLQLLREFWLPLLLAIAWTTFNFVDRPFPQWTVREVLNILGPTFFFVSWLVAQWFRVKKQQRVEDGISEIRRDVRAIHAPLLPIGLFLTLRAQHVEDLDLERLFKGEQGYREYGLEVPMPPPPIGLPPGMTEGRLQKPGGYVDYEGGVVKAAGIFKLGHPGFNVIHSPVQHTISSLSSKRLAQARTKNDPLLATPSVRIELYLGGQPKSDDVKPSLVLVSTNGNQHVDAVSALDNNIFVDHQLHLIPEPADQVRGWSASDLKGAFVRVTLTFFYIKPFFSLPEESWPSMQNLQLWLGPKADRVFAFSLEQLASQTVGLDPNPIARGQAECVRVQFSCLIDEAAYSKCLLSSA